MSEPNISLLKRVDDLCYALEQRLVTIAALLMTSTVCLDIVYRSLNGQQSQPFVSLISLFGVFGEVDPSLKTSLVPAIGLFLVPFGLGWAVYASLHRGEVNNIKSASIHGLFWSIGAYILAILIYALPSCYVCMLLSLSVGGLISYRATGNERLMNGTLTLLVAFGALSLPQGYIWSQELSLILLAWVAFLGASMATYQNKHIQISALAGLIPKNIKPYIRPLGLIITSLFTAYIASSLTISVFGDKGSFASGETRPATGIPAWIILFSGVIAFTLITVRSFVYGVQGFMYPDEQVEEELNN